MKLAWDVPPDLLCIRRGDVSSVQLLQCFHTWGMSARHRALVELDLDLEDPA